jgi:hypothetical protein
MIHTAETNGRYFPSENRQADIRFPAPDAWTPPIERFSPESARRVRTILLKEGLLPATDQPIRLFSSNAGIVEASLYNAEVTERPDQQVHFYATAQSFTAPDAIYRMLKKTPSAENHQFSYRPGLSAEMLTEGIEIGSLNAILDIDGMIKKAARKSDSHAQPFTETLGVFYDLLAPGGVVVIDAGNPLQQPDGRINRSTADAISALGQSKWRQIESRFAVQDIQAGPQKVKILQKL